MSGLIDLQSSSLYFRKSFNEIFLKAILKWFLKLFAAFCILAGLAMVLEFLFLLWLEDPEPSMTGIGSCGSYNCVDQ
jgi:hypothetical protein